MPRVQFSLDEPSEQGSKRPREDDDDFVQQKKIRFQQQDANETGSAIPSEHELMAAKQRRKELRGAQGMGSAGGTQIDENTTLASEGIAIEPFHMRNEENDGSGFFDGDTYVFRRNRTADIDDEPDAWVENLADMDGSKSKMALAVQPEPKMEEDNELSSVSASELYERMLPLLEGNETVTKALIRYGRLNKKAAKNPPPTDSPSPKDAMNKLTGIASMLLSRGEVEIYQYTRARIMKKIPKKNAIPVAKKGSKVSWEYRGSQDGQVHGPFSSEDMLKWRNAGYFVGEKRVLVRMIEAPSDEKQAVQDELLSELLDDSDDEKEAGSKGENPPAQSSSDWMFSDAIDFAPYVGAD